MGAVARRVNPHRVRRTLGAATCIRPAGRFVLNELRRARVPVEREYRLRDAGRTVVLRQPLVDMWPLEEVFRFREYDPPPEALTVLSRAQRPLRVLDLGGHIGLFGLFASSLFPDSSIVSFEPDPGNARLLARAIAANDLEPRWTLVQACAGPRDGRVELAAGYHLSRIVATPEESLADLQGEISAAHSFLAGTALTRADERLTVECRDVLPFMGEADLIKMDIEGAEWEILNDARFEQVRAAAIVLEYHDFHSPGGDPEESARATLAAAGYETGPARRGVENGTLWAWRSDARNS